MGQAKNRGTQAQRVEEARARERAKFPASVKCESCQTDLTEIRPMDVSGMPGITTAGAAECQACKKTSWVIHGTQAAVTEAYARLERIYGARGGVPQ